MNWLIRKYLIWKVGRLERRTKYLYDSKTCREIDRLLTILQCIKKETKRKKPMPLKFFTTVLSAMFRKGRRCWIKKGQRIRQGGKY